MVLCFYTCGRIKNTERARTAIDDNTYRVRRVAASNLVVLGDLDHAGGGRQQLDGRAVGLAPVGHLSSPEREVAPVLGADVVRMRNVGATVKIQYDTYDKR